MTRDEIATKYNGDYETADEIISEKVKNAATRAQCCRPHPDAPQNKKLEQYLCYDESTEADTEDVVVSSLFECRDDDKGRRKKQSKRKRSSSSDSSDDASDSSNSEDSSSSSESRRKSKKSKKKKGKKSKKTKKGKGGRGGGRTKKKSKEAKEKAKAREKQKEIKEKERAEEKDKQDLRSKAKKASIYLLHAWLFFPLPTIFCFW